VRSGVSPQPPGGSAGEWRAEPIVELIADAGAAAVEDEFFRSREFLAAEGVTHTLLAGAGGNEVAVPLVVRPIPGSDRRDAISPYSYPGARVSGGPVDRDAVDLAASGLVSAFVRDRLGEPLAFTAGTDRSVVLVSDPARPRKSRMSDRQQIRKNEAAGYAVAVASGPDASAAALDGFLAVYTETMRSVDAAERYFFDRGYFQALLASPLTWLFAVSGPDGDCAAAALLVRSDGFLHYYLSGTADAHRRRAPSKNLIVAATDHAEAAGLPLNLGGGVTPGDGLEEFKRGFANTELPFRTHELVCDPAAYAELSAGRPDSGFFPLYREP
jgi:hypothetical protein